MSLVDHNVTIWGPHGHTIPIMGLNLWGKIITIWGLHGKNNNDNVATLTIIIRGYTSIIGT